MEPLVYIIVITYNGRHHLEECLPSLQITAYSNYRTILVDNASSDGTYEYVRLEFPSVKIVRNPENYGYAKGNNIAIRQAIGEAARYVVLLNDDTVILDPNWLSQAVSVAQGETRVGMVGFDITNDIQATTPTTLMVQDVTRISGCALLIETELLTNVGLFDEIYFAYADEIDLEVRAMKAGYRLMEVKIPLFHKGWSSFSRIQRRYAFLYVRNVIRFSIKNEHALKALLRPLIIFDLFCNPFPIRRRDDDSLIRSRLDMGNFLQNLKIWTAAVLWNLVFLPQTLVISTRDRARIRATREILFKRATEKSAERPDNRV